MQQFKHRFFGLLTVGILLLGLPQASYAGGVLPDNLDYSFKLYSGQGPFQTPMPVSFDGTYYWGPSGGGTTAEFQQYDPLTGD